MKVLKCQLLLDLDDTQSILKKAEGILGDIQGTVGSNAVQNTVSTVTESLDDLRRRCGSVSECTELVPDAFHDLDIIQNIGGDFADVSFWQSLLTQSVYMGKLTW